MKLYTTKDVAAILGIAWWAVLSRASYRGVEGRRGGARSCYRLWSASDIKKLGPPIVRSQGELTTRELAAELGISKRAVLGRAEANGIGGRRAGRTMFWPASAVELLATRVPPWDRVDRTDPGLCWEWVGPTDKHGYGLMFAGGERYRAHRVAWEKEHGPIRRGLDIHHVCRNKGCVNPAHMVLVTPSQHGATHVGEEKGKSILKTRQVLRIRRECHSYRDCVRLAPELGVHPVTVWQVMKRRSWRHVA